MIKDTRQDVDLNITGSRRKTYFLLVDYLFNEIIPKYKFECSFEIGALGCDFSQKIKLIDENIQSFAFEANPYNYDLHKSKINPRISYINKAISDINGKITFNIQEYIDNKFVSPTKGNNSIYQKTYPNITYQTIEVESTTLSDFIVENNLLDKTSILWIDVEGANEKVLNGCDKILSQVDTIFIEVEEFMFWKNQWLEPQVRSFLNDRNFELVARDGETEKQYNQIYCRK